MSELNWSTSPACKGNKVQPYASSLQTGAWFPTPRAQAEQGDNDLTRKIAKHLRHATA